MRRYVPELGFVGVAVLMCPTTHERYALPDYVDRAIAAGFDIHFAKPPDLSELEQSIAEGRMSTEVAS